MHPASPDKEDHMAINSINTVTAAAAASTQTTTKSAEKTSETTKKAASSKTASGVIYEKSSDSRTLSLIHI